MSHPITIPKNCDIRVATWPAGHSVIVAPPPLKASLDLLSQPRVCPMFTFDKGVTWPDRNGCRWATEYLKAGHPIFLLFDNLPDALTCHKRVVRLAPPAAEGQRS